jgi:hypothetical protein
MLDFVENEFLSTGPWIGGENCAIADIHASWMIRSVMLGMDCQKEPGFGPKDYPKVHRWLNALPKHTPDEDGEKISAEDAKQKVLNSAYAAKDIGIDGTDPTGFSGGDRVIIVTTDE